MNVLVDMSLCVKVFPIIKITTAAGIKPRLQWHVHPPGASLSQSCALDPRVLRFVYIFSLFLGISTHYHNTALRK